MNANLASKFLQSIDQMVDHNERVVRRSFWFVAAGVAAFFVTSGQTDGMRILAAAMVAGAGLLPAWLWATRRAFGFPLVPAIALYDVIWFGTPILRGHEVVDSFSPPEILAAAAAESGFLLTICAVWYLLCRRLRTPPPKIRTLGTRPAHQKRLIRLAFVALALSTTFMMIVQAGEWWTVVRHLPRGSGPALQSALRLAGILSCFLLALALGSGVLGMAQRILLGALLLVYLSSQTLGLYLAPLIPVAAALVGGYSLATGRIPWKALVPAILVLNLLHIGKDGMREKYWRIYGSDYLECWPLGYPERYAEWFDYGLAALAGESEKVDMHEADSNKGDMLDRMSLLQMLLLAQSMAPSEVTFLHGESYSRGFGALVPRLLWPNKPSPHAGQALLNVHFRRQTVSETTETYIAWGMLAEAWANFGWLGVPALGLFLGLIFGGVGRSTIGVPIASYRFAIAAMLMTSGISTTQTATTLWCSSIFQAFLVVTVACTALTVKERNPLASPPPPDGSGSKSPQPAAPALAAGAAA